jgi:hypothetical protein
MKTRQITIRNPLPSFAELAPLTDIAPQLVLVFGALPTLQATGLMACLQSAFASAVLAGCSTAGEIGPSGVTDNALVLTAVRLDGCSVQLATTDLAAMHDSHAAGERLARQLTRPGLRCVLLLGQGVGINGSALIKGLSNALGPDVAISGGLAGDNGAFVQTVTVSSHAIDTHQIVAVGFFGEGLRVRHGSFHGWEPFGPARKVTRAHGNVLFELDGMPALDIYRRYLGEHARALPAAGLLFPFEMLGADRLGQGLIRTILGMDADAGSLVLAGDILSDGYLKLMHASIDSLVAGADMAGRQVAGGHDSTGDSLALLISCVGRKLVMGIRTDEEIEAVAQALGPRAMLAGFYSNGEIGPASGSNTCQLHNQTMTIMQLCEAP